MKKKILILLAVGVGLIFIGWGEQAQSAGLSHIFKWSWSRGEVTVMTRNIYVGTDVDMVLKAENPEQIPFLVADAYDMFLSTNFPERAEALAKEIACWRPHLVGLQEVSVVWRLSFSDGEPTYEVYNYLEILLEKLETRRLNYVVQGMIQNADVVMPMVNYETGELDFVGLTDFDVVLARKDVKISNVMAANYVARLSYPDIGIEVLRGYVAVDAKVGRKTYRFVNTHLEPDNLEVRNEQAQELVEVLQNETPPVILVGDLNTPAPYGETYQYMLSQDFVDVWTRNLVRFNRDGFTAGQEPDLMNVESKLDKRIDFIFVRSNVGIRGRQNIGPVFAFVVGDEQRDRTPSGLWPSDHAGVVACLRIPVLGRFKRR